MIWLAWRQFRGSATAAGAALALCATVLALTGPALSDALTTGLATCQVEGASCAPFVEEFFHDHLSAFLAVTAFVLVLPALVGMFWGAPLVAREIDEGTHLLVWNQSITRIRWLAVKLAVGGLAAVLAAGPVSAVVTWWVAPLDAAAVVDFPRMGPLLFGARGVVPVGYAAFAFTLGVAVGMLTRRTLPAMVITLVAFLAVQAAMSLVVRQHLIEPVRSTIPISESNVEEFKVARSGPDRVTLDAGNSGAWLLGSHTVDASGQPVDTIDVPTSTGPCSRTPQPSSSQLPSSQAPGACLAEMNRLGYRLEVTYQPPSRFWALQWIETGIYAALALCLAGFCQWRIRHLS